MDLLTDYEARAFRTKFMCIKNEYYYVICMSVYYINMQVFVCDIPSMNYVLPTSYSCPIILNPLALELDI